MSALELLDPVPERKEEEPVYSSVDDTCNSTPPTPSPKAQQVDLLVKGRNRKVLATYLVGT